MYTVRWKMHRPNLSTCCDLHVEVYAIFSLLLYTGFHYFAAILTCCAKGKAWIKNRKNFLCPYHWRCCIPKFSCRRLRIWHRLPILEVFRLLVGNRDLRGGIFLKSTPRGRGGLSAKFHGNWQSRLLSKCDGVFCGRTYIDRLGRNCYEESRLLTQHPQ